MAVFATAGVTLAGVGTVSTAAYAAKKPVAKKVAGKKALKRSFAKRASAGSEIMHARVKTVEPGLGFDFTDDLWMHVSASGVVDKVHELRLDGEYQTMESVITQPFGLESLEDALTQTRDTRNAPIRSAEGMGYGVWTMASVIATSIEVANGERDVSNATPVTFDGRPAYSLTLKDEVGEGRNPAQVSVRLFVDRASGAPIAARFGEGDKLWRTVYLESFQRLADSPANQDLLEFVD
jgi:hypothetical protein